MLNIFRNILFILFKIFVNLKKNLNPRSLGSIALRKNIENNQTKIENNTSKSNYEKNLKQFQN